MESEKKHYGTVRIGEANNYTTLGIEDFISGEFPGERKITISNIEGGTFVLSVENFPSSGRTSQSLHLTKESLMSLYIMMFLHLDIIGERENFRKYLDEAFDDGLELSYSSRFGEIMKSKNIIEEVD
jgi:hypothetical protein